MWRIDGGLRSRVWLAAVISLTLVAAACGDSARVAGVPRPVEGPPPPPPPPAPVLTEFPVVSSEAEIYLGEENIYSSSSDYHGGKILSRYVFYPEGGFALQFLSARFGFFEYTGRFTRADARITFDWDGWSAAGKWEARGLLQGDLLSVSYNVVMWLTDFVDGDYIRVRKAP